MLKKLLKRKAAGFTLIEIVLVLAIAGLILVIVFLAVAGAQRSQRNNARKDYTNRFVAAITDDAGNHDGTFAVANAVSATAFAVTVPGTIPTPTYAFGTATAATPAVNEMDWESAGSNTATQYKCAGTVTHGYVVMGLEPSGYYCAGY